MCLRVYELAFKGSDNLKYKNRMLKFINSNIKSDM